MIRVPRHEAHKPDGYDERAARWVAELRAALAADPTLTPSEFWGKKRKQFAEDARAMRVMFHDKCAFCESDLAHSQHPQVEHYRPKSDPRFVDLIFTWENLLLSCAVCNTHKGTKFPMEGGAPALLHPCEDEPAEHLRFDGGNIAPLSERGRKTIELVGLDRDELCRARALHLLSLKVALLAYLRRQEPQLLSWLAWSVHLSALWAGCARSLILDVVPWQHLEAHRRSSSYQDPTSTEAQAALWALLREDSAAFW